MAMFFTEEGAMTPAKIGRATAVMVLALAPSLSACSQSSLRLNPDFGNALRQDLASQVADPDAHYEGTPAPGAAGTRVNLAQKRYDTNTVVPPATTSATNGAMAGFQNGSPGGAGAGAGAGVSGGVSQ
jgi:hypothetical protein